ncbi:Mannose or cellobiose epimerase, N-acyl-D-glucosamine 2-epimerase family [Actinopolyspora xinjiangensis]|uniref:Mannose or cellobiose epimerase, N-acyl-D-glucosamine 2-epimerase family n=1 Tax=Actinopolyspora xinjiangensis TaxID=405564 RepID=A0A1H0RPJ7_9ACTN|nr:AGE family epimerase/isomerase [Actinopolyspora xinjiangensis]SDP30888.1 Mannose or cellobiose epimerase, N-acyl-D-glucosamine 2-epimerase family [Actinopolyspora xinjiangensis]
MTNPDLPEHHDWLMAERRRLLDFAVAARDAGGGFGWLDESGHLDTDRPVATWITARMTHVFSLAHLLGEPKAAELADHGIAALANRLHDAEHGGWYTSTADTTKGAYEHAFVVLASSSATAAARPGAEELLAEALRTVESRFWDDEVGLGLESWDRTWRTTESYRGANSNMHLVEAMLVAGDVTGERIWHQRALRIAGTLIDEVARAHAWRLPEHFTPEWDPELEYNSDRPQDPFRPHGTTVGHWLEWARLLLQLEASLGEEAPNWLVSDARNLFEAAIQHGWHADGHPGFVYTLDWQDRPQVRERMHWVIAEAVLTAAALYQRTAEPYYQRWYATFWDFARTRHLDHGQGSWHHELTPDGRPSTTVWSGKPDTYHAYQATLFPTLPLAPSAAVALRPARR